MPESNRPDRPTPPAIKWLLNERAMLAGEVQRREERMAALQSELGTLTHKIHSFDVALSMADNRVRPDAAGTVRGTAERYGGHGGLTRFLLEQVKAAGREGVDTRQLTLCAVSHFEALVTTEADLGRYLKDSVSPVLRSLRARGKVENVFLGKGGPKPSIWRVRAPGETFEDLLRQRDARP